MPSYLFSDAGTTFESQRMVFRQLNSGRLICPPLPSRLLFAVELFAFIVPPGIDGMSGGLICEFAPFLLTARAAVDFAGDEAIRRLR